MLLAQETRAPRARGVDHRSPRYLRWVQSSLNRITGARLPLDGILTPETRNVLRAFQSSRGLPSDGVLGKRTESALVAALRGGQPGRALAMRTLPPAGRGYYAYAPPAQRFAVPQTIRAIQAIGEAWLRRHPRGPRIGIGDLSRRGGAATTGHPVLHRRGIAVDIRPMRSDGREGPVRSGAPEYSRALTQELIAVIRANGILPVRAILFSDRGLSGARYRPGYETHLHVHFAAPGERPAPAPRTGSRVADRRTPEYIRWVQRSLNRIVGTDLRVDGIISPSVRSVLRAFQGRRGLPSDGVIGPRTEAALIAAGAGPPPIARR
jgi:peptidoglycan hydrolase-like protein with peptidoglycan-binding domain